MKKKNTAELYYRWQLIAYGILAAVWLVIWLAFYGAVGSEGESGMRAALIFVSLLFGAILVYDLVQYLRYKNMRFTDIQEVKLEHVSGNCGRRSTGFDIEVEQNGEKRSVTTKRAFLTSSLLGGPTLDKFAGYSYSVGYNEAGDEWVVLL